MERLDNFASVIQEDHENILTDWRERVRSRPRSRTLDRLTLEDGFRSFLDEITNALIYFHDTDNCLQTRRPLLVSTVGNDLTSVLILPT
jgi:hypothetical protein